MYYYGHRTTPADGASIGLATSVDGVHWQRHPTNPVLTTGAVGAWDGRWIESPAVVVDPNTDMHLMWYTGVDVSWQARLGLATSDDGVHWQRHPASPVLDLGGEGTWEDWMVGVAEVLREGEAYRLWYSGVSAADLADEAIDTPGVGFAYSPDGVQWTRWLHNPVLHTLDPPHDQAVDWHGPWAPTIVLAPSRDRYVMLYETGAGICLATAPGPSRVRRPTARVGSP
jgi:hypothetical protein